MCHLTLRLPLIKIKFNISFVLWLCQTVAITSQTLIKIVQVQSKKLLLNMPVIKTWITNYRIRLYCPDLNTKLKLKTILYTIQKYSLSTMTGISTLKRPFSELYLKILFFHLTSKKDVFNLGVFFKSHKQISLCVWICDWWFRCLVRFAQKASHIRVWARNWEITGCKLVYTFMLVFQKLSPKTHKIWCLASHKNHFCAIISVSIATMIFTCMV